MTRRPVAILLVLGVVVFAVPDFPAISRPMLPRADVPTRGTGSLRFEENRGQTDRRVGFVTRGPGFALFLSPDAAVFALADRSANRTTGPAKCGESIATEEDVVRLAFDGANGSAAMRGEDALPGRASYFTGRNESTWHRGVRSFARVRSTDVYPGIDVVYYGSDTGALEYDFIVAPNADPSAIRLRVEGATSVRLDGGDLVATTRFGELRQKRPALFQSVGGIRRSVPGAFVRLSENAIGFSVGAYNRSFPLVIDPVLSLSTFLGGSTSDVALSTDVDAAGAIYLLGQTRSLDFPSAVELPGTVRGEVDLFVAKLNPAGSTIVYAVYIGGSGNELAASVRVDGSGNAVVRGFSFSTDFPLVNAAQSQFGGDRDSVVFKINASGTGFVFSTFLGGSGFEDCYTGLDVDAAGNIYVSGCTTSTDFPTMNAYDTTIGGTQDGYIVKYRPDGRRVYSTYLGGSTDGEAIYEIAALPNGALVVSGTSFSPDFPTVNAIQPMNAGGYDGIVAQLSPSGRELEFATYYGGTGDELFGRIAVDAAGNLYVGASTTSADFPTVAPFQTGFGGGSQDGAVLKLAANGQRVLFASYFGGSGYEAVLGVAVDGRGAVLVSGDTDSVDFPVHDAIQSEYGGGLTDLFAARIAPDGGALEYSTYLGGIDRDSTNHSAVDRDGNLYVAFLTASADFPLVRPFQGTLNGTQDPGIAKISDVYEVRWDAPSGEGGAPQNAEARLAGGGSAPGVVAETRDVRALTGYKVYRSAGAGVAPSPGNLFVTLPPSTTTTGPTAPGGSFFVVTACYDDGSESAPSNEAGAGTGAGPVLSKVKVKPTKITAKGSGFSATVQVFLDGIPFAQPATIKAGKKVTQTGTLLTGETVGAYLAAHDNRAVVSVRNSNGTISVFGYSR